MQQLERNAGAAQRSCVWNWVGLGRPGVVEAQGAPYSLRSSSASLSTCSERARAWTTRELKRQLAHGRIRKRYPAELREAVLAYAAKRPAERVSQSKVAAELGMSEQTLGYWRALARERGGSAPVTIVANPERSHDVVVECGPLRVRGLGVSGVAELLRRLG